MTFREDWEHRIIPGSVPSTPVIWPADRHQSNQIQQTKGSAKPQVQVVLPSTQPSKSTVAPRTTPAMVTHVRTVTKAPANGQKSITVQFNHPTSDPYFSGANVYLRRAGRNQQPVLVASGASSPLAFTVPTHQAPHAIYVTSVGNWGETDIASSPSRRVSIL